MLERAAQVVEVHGGVVGDEADARALSAWQEFTLNHGFDGGGGELEVASVDGRLGDVEDEDIGGRHGRAVHVLVGC